MIQCIRTFQRYPDTPTMKLSVQQIDEPLRLEGVILNLGSDELYQGVTIKIARVQEDEEDAGVLHVILTADDVGHLKLHKSDKLTGASTQLPVDLVATDAITLKVMAADDPVGSWDYTQSPEGPKERRRLWIACATKIFGETLVEKCKQIGATNRFYHAGVGSKPVEGTSAKEDVKNTSAAWRNIHVIISTTTIEVAINVKLPFLARWIFATHRQGSLASELMQLVSRVPRGQEEDERNARLTDHRIFVLFGTGRPKCRMPTPVDCVEQVDDSEKIESSAKSYMISGQKAHTEGSRTKRAKLVQLGEASVGQSIPVDESLNALRGSVKHYRQLNVGAKHAVRFFEIAAKCGDARPTSLSRFKIALEELKGKDETALRPVVTTMLRIANELDNDVFEQQMDAGDLADRIDVWMSEPGMQSFQQEAVGKVLCMLEKHEEMPPLTDEEKAELEAHRQERAKEAQARESDARALLNDAFRESKAVDTPKNAPKRYELVVNYQRAQAQQIAESEELDEATALTQVRRDFWKYCEWMLGNTRNNDRSAFQMLQLDVYFNLQPFIFGDDALVDAFEYIDQDDCPGEQYCSISELKTGNIRLARLRTLSVETLRAETQLKTEKKEAHVESIDLESLRAINVHTFFSLLQVPDHQEMEPLAWLTHGAELWPADGVSQCRDAHNRLIRNNLADRNQPEKLVYPAAEEHLLRGDMDLRRKLLPMAHNIAGEAVPRTGSKGIPSIAQAIKHALFAIGLKVDFNEKRAGSRNYAGACVVYEASLRGKRPVGFSLADAVEIRVRGRVAARAADFRLAREGDEHERAAAVSDEEANEQDPEPSRQPQHVLGHEIEEAFDPDEPRREGFDANALTAALAELQSDSADRAGALARINHMLQPHHHHGRNQLLQDGRFELNNDKLILRKSLDLEDQLRALDAALSPTDAFGRRWLSVRYELSHFGRRRTVIDEDAAIQMRTLDDDEDPSARTRLQPVGYSGLSPELRGMLGGSLKCGLPRISELKVPWAVLVLDVSIRLNVPLFQQDDSPSMLQRLKYDGDEIANGVRTHYFGHAANPAADHVTAALELLEACVHGGITHGTWLGRYGLAVDTPRSPLVTDLQRDVRQVRDAVFESDAYGDAIRRLSRTLTHLEEGDRRRTLWIRWLQQREDTVLGDIEAELHVVRRTSNMPWFNLKFESECDDSGVSLLERLAPYRPLYPVAFVRGSLLVEDARCKPEPPGTPEHVSQVTAAQAAQENYHLMGQASTPSPTGSIRSSQSDNEIDTPRSERQARKETLDIQVFERKVLLSTPSPLECCPRRWEGLKLVATPLTPHHSSSLPTLVRARAIAARYPDPFAAQFEDEAEIGDGGEQMEE